MSFFRFWGNSAAPRVRCCVFRKLKKRREQILFFHRPPVRRRHFAVCTDQYVSVPSILLLSGRAITRLRALSRDMLLRKSDVCTGGRLRVRRPRATVISVHRNRYRTQDFQSYFVQWIGCISTEFRKKIPEIDRTVFVCRHDGFVFSHDFHRKLICGQDVLWNG